MFGHGLMLVYQDWFALIVLGTLSIKVEFTKQGVDKDLKCGKCHTYFLYRDIDAIFSLYAEPQQQQSSQLCWGQHYYQQILSLDSSGSQPSVNI